MTDLLEHAAGLPVPLLYVITGLLAFGDSAFLTDLVLPGETGMVFMGAAVEQAEASLVLAVSGCVVGALAGDSVGFLVGRRWGWALVDRWTWVRRRLGPRVSRAEGVFADHGALAVFSGRWVGALRAVVPLVAGTTTMSYRRFIAWDAVAALPWAVVVVGAGFLFGDDAARFVDVFGWWLTVVVLAVVAGYLFVRRWRRRGGGPSGGAGRRSRAPRPTAREPAARDTSPRACR